MSAPSETQGENSPNLTPEELSEIHKKGRWLRRVCQPFEEFEDLILVGLYSQEATRRLIDPQTREYITDRAPIVIDLRAEDANTINDHLPLIAARLNSATTTPEMVTLIANKVQHAANGGKDTDTKNMKHDILGLIPEEYLPSADAQLEGIRRVATAYIDSPNPEGEKIWRGLNNVVTARLLCPAKYLEEFKRDPEGTRKRLKRRDLKRVDARGCPFFPAFLYDEKVMDGTSTKGVFRGPLLLKIYRSIFLGPSQSHTIGTKKSKKRGNAAINNMHSVKPSTICYAAIHAYIALSDMVGWGIKDGEVNLSTLYDLLRQQFRNPDDPWVKETLEWWNSQIFPTPADSHDDTDDFRDMEGPTMSELMEREREARMSQMDAPASATSD